MGCALIERSVVDTISFGLHAEVSLCKILNHNLLPVDFGVCGILGLFHHHGTSSVVVFMAVRDVFGAFP